MVALNFKTVFADDIELGRKTRTIRKIRARGNPVAGCALQLYTKLRSKSAEKLRDATCTQVRPVLIDHTGVTLNGRALWAGDAPAYQGGPDPENYDGDFARADGFDAFGDMVEFFEKQYGLPFEGQLIEWKA